MDVDLRQLVASIANSGESAKGAVSRLKQISNDIICNQEQDAKEVQKILIEAVQKMLQEKQFDIALPCIEFLRKTNWNDQWLVAGSEVVLPSLPTLCKKLLPSSSADLAQKNPSDKFLNSLWNQTSAEQRDSCLKIVSTIFELGVDFCDVNSIISEKHLKKIATLSCTILFSAAFESTPTGYSAYNYLVDSVKRTASYAIANTLDSFPSSIPEFAKKMDTHQIKLFESICYAAEVSIRRSCVQILRAFFNCPKNNTCSSWIQKYKEHIAENWKEKSVAKLILQKFSTLDISSADILEAIDDYLRIIDENTGDVPCVVTRGCKVKIWNVPPQKSESYSDVSVDWNKQSLVIRSTDGSRERILFHDVKLMTRSRKGLSLRIQVGHPTTVEVQLRLPRASSAVDHIVTQLQKTYLASPSPDQQVAVRPMSKRKVSKAVRMELDEPSPKQNFGQDNHLPNSRPEQPTIFSGLCFDNVLLFEEQSLQKEETPSVSTMKERKEDSTLLKNPFHCFDEKTKGSNLGSAASKRLDPQSQNRDTASCDDGASKAVQQPAINEFAHRTLASSAPRISLAREQISSSPLVQNTAGQGYQCQTKTVSQQESDPLNTQTFDQSHRATKLQPGPFDISKRLVTRSAELCHKSSSTQKNDLDVQMGKIAELTVDPKKYCVVSRSPCRPNALDRQEDPEKIRSCLIYPERISSHGKGEGTNIACETSEDVLPNLLHLNESRLHIPKASQKPPQDSSPESSNSCAAVAFSDEENEDAYETAVAKIAMNSNTPVADDDDMGVFRSSMLGVVESAIKSRNRQTKVLKGRAQKRISKLYSQARQADKGAINMFTNLVSREINSCKSKICASRRDELKVLKALVDKISSWNEKRKQAKQRLLELKQQIIQQIASASKELEAVHKKLIQDIRSCYHANLVRRQALHQSDQVFRGITELLTTTKSV